MTTEQIVIRLTTPEETLQSVPYLLGFEPKDSLVVITMVNNRIKFSARIDIGEDTTPIWAAAQRHEVDAVLLVGYANDQEVAEAALSRAALACPIASWQAMWVTDGQFGVLYDNYRGSLRSDQTSCAVAQMVSVGHAALPDRAQIETAFAPLSDDAALEFMFYSAPATRLPELEGLGAVDVDWTLAAALAKAVVDIEGRDEWWLDLEELTCTVTELHILGDRFRECARRVPESHRVPLLFLACWAYWRSGAGAWANVGIEYLISLDPTYSAAALLHSALIGGANPHELPRLKKDQHFN